MNRCQTIQTKNNEVSNHMQHICINIKVMLGWYTDVSKSLNSSCKIYIIKVKYNTKIYWSFYVNIILRKVSKYWTKTLEIEIQQQI